MPFIFCSWFPLYKKVNLRRKKPWEKAQYDILTRKMSLCTILDLFRSFFYLDMIWNIIMKSFHLESWWIVMWRWQSNKWLSSPYISMYVQYYKGCNVCSKMISHITSNCFTYVTKTIANLTTYSRKHYNGTIVFEIDIMKTHPHSIQTSHFLPLSKPK